MRANGKFGDRQIDISAQAKQQWHVEQMIIIHVECTPCGKLSMSLWSRNLRTEAKRNEKKNDEILRGKFASRAVEVNN